MNEKIFPNQLKARRVERGIKQKDLAEALGVPLRTYQSYEYGDAEPGIVLLGDIAYMLQTSVDELIGLSAGSRLAADILFKYRRLQRMGLVDENGNIDENKVLHFCRVLAMDEDTMRFIIKHGAEMNGGG